MRFTLHRNGLTNQNNSRLSLHNKHIDLYLAAASRSSIAFDCGSVLMSVCLSVFLPQFITMFLTWHLHNANQIFISWHFWGMQSFRWKSWSPRSHEPFEIYLMSTRWPMLFWRIRFIFGKIQTRLGRWVTHNVLVKVQRSGLTGCWKFYEYLQEVATDITSLYSVAPVIIIQHINHIYIIYIIYKMLSRNIPVSCLVTSGIFRRDHYIRKQNIDYVNGLTRYRVISYRLNPCLISKQHDAIAILTKSTITHQNIYV